MNRRRPGHLETMRLYIENWVNTRPITTLYFIVWVGVFAYLDTAGVRLW